MHRFSCFALILGVASLGFGCTNEPTELSRDEARRMAGSSADSGRDLCEEYGWYGDGLWCDEFCPSLDPDCNAACLSHDDCPPIFCASGVDCLETSCVAGNCAIEEDCTAELAWLQKDAYLSQAGRSQAFWPPHTTMVLTVSCGGAMVREAIAANHGTLPDAVDDSGTPILEEVWSDQVTGSREELMALADNFEGCECGTEFLSLDALEDSAVQELVGELASYLNTNLDCPESIGGTQAIVDALVAQDVEFVLGNAGRCTWSSGGSWEEGLDTALTDVAQAASSTLADYHVCNNDAVLQADLFERFRTGDTRACNANASSCSGPAWFYNPGR